MKAEKVRGLEWEIRPGDKVILYKWENHVGSIFIDVDKIPETDYLSNFFVRPDYKGQGYGSMILDRALAVSQSRFQRLEVELGNTLALSMYKKRGFVENGPGPVRNSISMVRESKKK